MAPALPLRQSALCATLLRESYISTVAKMMSVRELQILGEEREEKDRLGCRESLLAFGLGKNVITVQLHSYVLPATFEAPWVKGEAAREELRAQKQEEEDERQRQYRAALGIPVGPMPRGGGLMNAAAFGVGNLNI